MSSTVMLRVRSFVNPTCPEESNTSYSTFSTESVVKVKRKKNMPKEKRTSNSGRKIEFRGPHGGGGGATRYIIFSCDA